MANHLSFLKKGLYQHYKGQYYEVIDIAEHTETNEKMVIYRALYNDFKLWVRPLLMFIEEIEINNLKIPRFKYIDKKDKK